MLDFRCICQCGKHARIPVSLQHATEWCGGDAPVHSLDLDLPSQLRPMLLFSLSVES